jgi:hypothetical protein
MDRTLPAHQAVLEVPKAEPGGRQANSWRSSFGVEVDAAGRDGGGEVVEGARVDVAVEAEVDLGALGDRVALLGDRARDGEAVLDRRKRLVVAHAGARGEGGEGDPCQRGALVLGYAGRCEAASADRRGRRGRGGRACPRVYPAGEWLCEWRGGGAGAPQVRCRCIRPVRPRVVAASVLRALLPMGARSMPVQAAWRIPRGRGLIKRRGLGTVVDPPLARLVSSGRFRQLRSGPRPSSCHDLEPGSLWCCEVSVQNSLSLSWPWRLRP